jgi:hypothetical protein
MSAKTKSSRAMRRLVSFDRTFMDEIGFSQYNITSSEMECRLLWLL